VHGAGAGGGGGKPFRVRQNPDLSFLFYSPSLRVTLEFRDVTPKDFYFLAYLEEESEFKEEDTVKTFMVLEHLAKSPEDFGKVLSLPQWAFWFLAQEMFNNCLKGKVMSPNQWLEVAFHLCKQRWDSSVDWLENQPMSKINEMIGIQSRYAASLVKTRD